jgi:hypothetical protein
VICGCKSPINGGPSLVVTSRLRLASLQDAFDLGQIPGLKPRLRKAYVAAKLFDYAGCQTRARRSVAKEAWAEFYCPFRAEVCTGPLSPMERSRRKSRLESARTRLAHGMQLRPREDPRPLHHDKKLDALRVPKLPRSEEKSATLAALLSNYSDRKILFLF